MGRSNLCIFCGSPATSREHLLPACLGGRIERKGILCRSCNSKAGHLDAALERELRPFNMMLDVRSTRDLEPKHVPVRHERSDIPLMLDPSGEIFEPPHVKESVENGVWSAHVSVPNERELQRVLAELRKRHSQPLAFTPHPRRRRRRTLGPIKIESGFGGITCLRATARVVLNFLAHFEYDMAQMGELLEFKSWLFAAADEPQAWAALSSFPRSADSANTEEAFDEHRVLLWAQGGEVFSWVSLFGVFALDFRLGKTSFDMKARDIRLRLCETNAAKAIRVLPIGDTPTALHCLSGQEPNMEQIQERLTAFAQHTSKVRDERRNQEVLKRVLGAISQQHGDVYDRVFRALQREDQGILLTVVEAAQMLERVLDKTNVYSPGLRELLQLMTSYEAPAELAVQPLIECLTDLVRRAMSTELLAVLSRRPLSSADIQDVVRGSTAIRLALRVTAQLLSMIDIRWTELGKLKWGATRSEEMALQGVGSDLTTPR